MKFLTSQIMHFLKPASSRRNVGLLAQFLGLLAAIITAFSVGFHILMLYEGEDYSWITGFYWTMTTMSTLGFGDITFETDAGKIFSVIVLMTGMIFLLVLLPFTFIEFFYSPWMKQQEESRAPKAVPDDITDHAVIATHDPVTAAFITRLKKYNFPYILVAQNLTEALEFYDEGISVVQIDLESPDAFQHLGLERASMLVTTGSDVANTSIAFSAREIAPDLPIVATANSVDSVDVLQFAGCTQIIELGERLGQSLARRTVAGDAQAHVIGEIGEIRIAEATAAGTPLVGKTILQSNIREKTGLTVIGFWERGKFRAPRPDDLLEAHSVLVLAGTDEHVARYNALMCIYHQSQAPVVIIGAGRVGRAAARALASFGTDCRIVDKDPTRATNPEIFVVGSAADRKTLEAAGIQDAPAVIITTHDDDVNIYLTIYCRKLRPDIQILARSTMEANTTRLHRAGADLVMSYATTGANILFNRLRKGDDILMVTEGLNVFRLPLPPALSGKRLRESKVREVTGCSIIALEREGEMLMAPDPGDVLLRGDGLVLIGTVESENTFLREFCKK